MRTRRGRLPNTPSAPPVCQHCGSPGHICPRTSYREDLPALSCPSCIRTVRSAYCAESSNHQIVITIDPCNLHSTTAARPGRPTSIGARPGRGHAVQLPPPPPAIVPVSANPPAPANPPARRAMRVFSLDGAIAEYDGVVTVVNSGQPLSAALGASGLSHRPTDSCA